jgi:undecaprenyl diphosphate synthase
LKLLKKYLLREVDELYRNNVQLHIIGEKDRLSPDLREVLDNSVTKLAGNTGLKLVFAISYGSRRELARAAKLFAQDCVKGRASPESMNEETMRQYLWTSTLGDLDQVDLIIRTSGEKRVSNFLLWQAAYAEFVFSDLYWPDFTIAHFRSAIEDYSSRERRFGGVLPAEAIPEVLA